MKRNKDMRGYEREREINGVTICTNKEIKYTYQPTASNVYYQRLILTVLVLY